MKELYEAKAIEISAISMKIKKIKDNWTFVTEKWKHSKKRKKTSQEWMKNFSEIF